MGYFRVLGNRSFFYLWAATLVSRTGDNLLSIAMLWFVYGVLTHNVMYAGLIAAAYYAPTFLFAPVFGKIADGYNRKKVMIAATLSEMTFAILLYLSITFDVFVLQTSFIAVFSIASFGFLVSISRSSSIPLTVPKDELTAANSLQQATTQLTRIFGFLAGGALLLLLGIRGIALIQARTPNERLGSVLAALSLLLLGSASLSMMASGLLVDVMGVQGVYLFFALLMLVTCAAATNMKELRNASY